MKYATIIPLIGGMTLGHMKALNTYPEFILSYDPFYENDRHLMEYFKKLNKNIPYISLTSDENKNNFLNNKNLYKDLDFVSAVPPCAGLTSLNTNNDPRNNGPFAEQNKWIMGASQFIMEHVRPKVFFLENSSYLLSNKGRELFLHETKKANKLGYKTLGYKTLNYLHETPQTRRRAFLFYFRGDKVPIFDFSQKNNEDWRTIIDSIKNRDSEEYNSYGRYDSLVENLYYKFFKEILKIDDVHIPFYIDATDYILKNKLHDKFKDYLLKLNTKQSLQKIRKIDFFIHKKSRGMGFYDDWDSFKCSCTDIFPTINSKSYGSMIHHSENRFVNLRELMSLMGIPEDFDLQKKSNGKFLVNHIAQNVPVNTSAWFTKQVEKFIKGEFLEYSNENIIIDNIYRKITPITTKIENKLI